MGELEDLINWTAGQIAAYRQSVGERPVVPPADADTLRNQLGGPLPTKGIDAGEVLQQLVTSVDPVIVAGAGPRYFGFVVGGSLDAALGADLLTSGWDQVAFNFTTSPAAAVVEEVAGGWLKQALGLPEGASFALVTGGQGANTVSLACARHRVLAGAGWNVEEQGLIGAPPVRVVAGAERHATIDRALQLLGLGARSLELVPAGANGAMDTAALPAVLEELADGPTIVCLQAGNVDTGAFDDLAAGIAAARRRGAWVHVDGAFGLWAAANPATAHLVAGMDQADSWAVDGHKWLNVPYDCGYAFCADPETHVAAMSYPTAHYLVGKGANRAPADFTMESSRRARGFATWAALRQLGRQGLAEMIERCCSHARRFAAELGGIDGVEIGNDVVLNQVLVSFGSDERTDRVMAAIQQEGTCWAGGTTWKGRRYMRISVSNWSTTAADIDRSVEAIKRVLGADGQSFYR